MMQQTKENKNYVFYMNYPQLNNSILFLYLRFDFDLEKTKPFKLSPKMEFLYNYSILTVHILSAYHNTN